MEKNKIKSKGIAFEYKIVFTLSVLFMLVVAGAWFYSLKLRQAITAKNTIVQVDVQALVDVERIRNTFEAQVDNSLLFFLMGSTSLFDEQKKNKLNFLSELSTFEKKYKLPQLAQLSRQLTDQQLLLQEFFDQSMDFRAKKTESKIVGQFFKSKANPIRVAVNKSLDEIIALHHAEAARIETQIQTETLNADVQVPIGMSWFAGLTGFIFLSLVVLTVILLNRRPAELAERQRLFEEAQKATHARDEVVAAISQDFKEPLSKIMQAVQVMSTAPDKNKSFELAELVQSCAFMIEDRVKDIVDQSKIKMGTLTLRLEQRSIETVLEDARLMLQPLAKKKDIRLEFNTVNSSILAFIDTERVTRVFSNLVSNAIKFSPHMSKVVIKARSDSQFVYVSIKDSGPGISEKQLPHVFDQFWQASNTAHEGAGVGLAVVKTVIEAHGGSVSVESHVGHGTTFMFSLPRRRPVGLNLGKPTIPPARSSVIAAPQQDVTTAES